MCMQSTKSSLNQALIKIKIHESVKFIQVEYDKEQKGGVSAIEGVQGFLVTAIGQKVPYFCFLLLSFLIWWK